MKAQIKILIPVLLITQFAFSQNKFVKMANENYEQYNYVEAIELYKKAIEKGYSSAEIFGKLGDSYFFNSKMNDARLWYDQMFALESDQAPEYHYRYAQVLKSEGDYEGAATYYKTYAQKGGDAEETILSLKYLEELEKNKNAFKIVIIPDLNSSQSDFGVAIYQGVTVYASSRDSVKFSNSIHKWTGKPFLDLYTYDGGVVKPFSRTVNSQYHESTPAFSPDGKTMYFTRSNFLDGEYGQDENHINRLKIYQASLEDGNWINIEELPFNNDQYSVAHPVLTKDGSIMYFVSDQPGGQGKSDIYSVTIKEDGSFGKPINLGDKINTDAKESFPFIAEDNKLYFASDGHPGLGGLDVFVVDLKDKEQQIVNLGAPLNSNLDDFGFVLTQSEKGFISSNREGGEGDDDIYNIVQLKPLYIPCNQSVNGTIRDNSNELPISDVKIMIYDSEGKLVKEALTDEGGNFTVDIECPESYTFKINKPFYDDSEETVTLDRINGRQNSLNFSINKTVEETLAGADLNNLLNLNPIYFDFDSHQIRKDASVELDKVVKVMKDHPNIKIQIRSHTDCRGNDIYNKILSGRRAKSTANYIVNKGIKDTRVNFEGFGEKEIGNKCEDNVPCSGKEHEENRRSEFIIIN